MNNQPMRCFVNAPPEATSEWNEDRSSHFERKSEMYQSHFVVLYGRVLNLPDGRISAFGQPEPEFLRRRYEHAEELRKLDREARIKKLLSQESEGFVERIRSRLGIAQ